MRNLVIGLILAFLAASSGCGGGPQLAPVKGRVLYNEKPLPFGSVMFQPASGQPARATIRTDGSFVLGTFGAADGATVGPNRVRVTCFEAQNPEAANGGSGGEMPLGKSLIPKQYTQYDTSGLKVDVPPEGNDTVELRLTGPELPN